MWSDARDPLVIIGGKQPVPLHLNATLGCSGQSEAQRGGADGFRTAKATVSEFQDISLESQETAILAIRGTRFVRVKATHIRRAAEIQRKSFVRSIGKLAISSEFGTIQHGSWNEPV